MTSTGVAMPTFIKAAEVWLPTADGTLLEFGGGLHGPASHMARVSSDMCFGRGEGLPGRAWDSGEPVVLQGFEGSYFKRTAAALADGLTCGIAVPIFMATTLRAVLVLFCGDDESHAGAIEVWMNDPAISKDMTLADGHYGRTGDAFEFISCRTSFRPGVGLPGMAWQQGGPVFMPDLGKGSGFLRADSAVKVGINRGLALPCATLGHRRYVLAFLSALGTPIAMRIEIWRPDAAGQHLRLSAGFCESAGLLSADGTKVAPGEGCVGRCWQSGLPTIGTDQAHEASDPPPGGQGVVALPVFQDENFAAAVALHF